MMVYDNIRREADEFHDLISFLRLIDKHGYGDYSVKLFRSNGACSNMGVGMCETVCGACLDRAVRIHNYLLSCGISLFKQSDNDEIGYANEIGIVDIVALLNNQQDGFVYD